MSDDPISVWIDELRLGDAAAATHLWNHFVCRLYELAKQKLRLSSRRVYDEEDAALSAFHSVCAGITEGRFPDLRDRNGLWRLMLVITAQKISNRHRYDRRQRRSVQRTVTDSIFSHSFDSTAKGGHTVTSREPTPEFAAEFVEICERLFLSLDDSHLQEMATLKMEGYTDTEIADRLNCSRRTVQRRVTIIRRHWERLELADE